MNSDLQNPLTVHEYGRGRVHRQPRPGEAETEGFLGIFGHTV